MIRNRTNTLLVDAGNSCLKWALSRQDHFEAGPPVMYQKTSRPSSRQSLLVSQLIESWRSKVKSGSLPDNIIVSNVAGAWVLDALDQWIKGPLQEGLSVKDEKGLTIDIVVAQEYAFGVKNAYHEADLLGADRWAGLIAAHHLVPGDSCIIDCGTALTIDVLSEDGVHQGGTISPGWEMMKNSLIRDTDAINGETLADQISRPGLLGSNTQEGVEAGVAAACAGAIQYVVERYQDEANTKLNCVITGGCAQHVLPLLLQQNPEGVFQYEPDWVLKGLAIISEGDVVKENDKSHGAMK